MIWPCEYAPLGRFVFSLDENGQMVRHPLWQLECWLFRYTDYPDTPPPNKWLEIDGETLCVFQAYDFAKYRESLLGIERKKRQSGLKPLRAKCTNTGI